MYTPFVLVIFGATGDLTAHKLIPALFSLFKQDQLPKNFKIIGFARRPLSRTEFANHFEDFLQDPKWKQFASHLLYQQGDFGEEHAYTQLAQMLKEYDKSISSETVTHIFYLATPPQYYETILSYLRKHKKALSQKTPQVNKKFARLAIEKPFGKDLETAQMLDKKLADHFDEWQVFRVDHYLGKEALQNMLVFRFANNLFEPVWNNEFIDHVQITLSEQKGIGGRGKFFDGVGTLRDVGQNHLMQLIAAVAMEMPKSFTKENVRDARAHAIEAIECIKPEAVHASVIRGQYEGYTKERQVDPESQTETFIAMKFFVNTPRFAHVPFYVRAGKGLARNNVSISLIFKQSCHILFKEVGCPEEGSVLTFTVQPKERISLKLVGKKPGTKLDLQVVDMHLSYAEQFSKQSGDAYEKILADIVLTGDQMLFNRSDELASSWRFITNILKGWETNKKARLFPYALGTTGPKEADTLIEKDARTWINE